VDPKQANFFACVRTRTAESYFQSFENRRAGAQTKLFDEKVLVKGEKRTRGPVVDSPVFNLDFLPKYDKI